MSIMDVKSAYRTLINEERKAEKEELEAHDEQTNEENVKEYVTKDGKHKVVIEIEKTEDGEEVFEVEVYEITSTENFETRAKAKKAFDKIVKDLEAEETEVEPEPEAETEAEPEETEVEPEADATEPEDPTE